MNAKKFKTDAEIKLAELERFIQTWVPSKGDSEEGCQQLCLINRINALRHTINGVEDSDIG